MYCSQCGADNPADARFCVACGAPTDPQERDLVARETGAFTGRPPGVAGYGGFWRRVLAVIIDALVLFIPLALIQSVVAPGSMDAGMHGGSMSKGYGVHYGVGAYWIWWSGVELIAAWLYWAGLHSSVYQATVGKMALELCVTDLQGRRISFLRATGRYLATFLSALVFMIGYLMVAFHPRKQGLHDLIAGTLVIRPRE